MACGLDSPAKTRVDLATPAVIEQRQVRPRTRKAIFLDVFMSNSLVVNKSFRFFGYNTNLKLSARKKPLGSSSQAVFVE
jgi:hypothetical protein